MSDTVKLIIEIPKPMYESVQNGTYCGTLYEELKNGIPLDSLKAEIKEKCDRINDIASALSYLQHRGIQELLCEILASIDKAESIDPNDMTRMFERVTEIPKDAFKGWTIEEILDQIRAERGEKANGKNE